MKITVKEEKEVEVKFLLASCGVRYWEDAEIDGVADEKGDLTPCRKGDCWEPLIDLETGVILNWQKGRTADIHFKVCDAGEYSLLDGDKKVVKKIDGYVPPIMSPEDEGYGDYIIMKVDAEGKIAKWKPDFKKFDDEDE